MTRDWETIEREFRAGQLSIRQIARQHGLDEKSIRKRAKGYGWERDLTNRVAAKVRSELVRSENRTYNVRTELEIVNDAAARAVEVVRQHRHAFSRLTSLRDHLLDRCERLLVAVVDLRTCAQAADSLESLARTTARFVLLERQAFNLDRPMESSNDSSAERDRQAAELLARLHDARTREFGEAPSLDASKSEADSGAAE